MSHHETVPVLVLWDLMGKEQRYTLLWRAADEWCRTFSPAQLEYYTNGGLWIYLPARIRQLVLNTLQADADLIERLADAMQNPEFINHHEG